MKNTNPKQRSGASFFDLINRPIEFFLIRHRNLQMQIFSTKSSEAGQHDRGREDRHIDLALVSTVTHPIFLLSFFLFFCCSLTCLFALHRQTHLNRHIHLHTHYPILTSPFEIILTLVTKKIFISFHPFPLLHPLFIPFSYTFILKKTLHRLFCLNYRLLPITPLPTRCCSSLKCASWYVCFRHHH